MDKTQETLDAVKAAFGNGDLEKANTITVGSGLTAYDLQAPAKNLYPVFTPLRNKIPRVGGGKGSATNWRTVNSIVGSGFDNTPWIPEGQRAGRMSMSTSPKAASYVTIGEETSVTFEAESAGRTFEDVRATATVRLLQKMMLKEENAILGGNATLELGTPDAPVATAGGTGGSIGADDYEVKVVALTQEGYYNSSVANGVAVSATVTGADGQSFTVNGGSSDASTNDTVTVTSGQQISATVAPVVGAVAYAWFVGTDATTNCKLQAITTINSVKLASLTTSTQAVTAITGDHSTNELAFDGLLTTALSDGSNAYVKVLATGSAGVGTPLTTGGRGNVNELDDMLKSMWDNYQLGATVIYVNSQEQRSITDLVMAAAEGTILRYNSDSRSKEPYAVVAGGMVQAYFNPFMPEGGAIIPIKIHPKVPPGTIVAWCEDLPIYYQNNEVQNVAEVKTRRDYYQIDWPLRTRAYESGVYAEEVLAVYVPFAMGVISNIAPA